MTKNKLVNQGAVRRVYRQIILLGMLVHVPVSYTHLRILSVGLAPFLSIEHPVSLKLTPSVFFIISDIAKAGRRKEKRFKVLTKL